MVHVDAEKDSLKKGALNGKKERHNGRRRSG